MPSTTFETTTSSKQLEISRKSGLGARNDASVSSRGACWQASIAGLTGHWSTTALRITQSGARQGMLRNVLRRLHRQIPPGGSSEDRRSVLSRTFSIDVASSPLERFSLEAAPAGDLFGTSVIAETIDWNPLQEHADLGLAEETAGTRRASRAIPTASELTRAPDSKPSDATNGRDRRAHPRHESGCIVAVLPRRNGTPASRDRIEWLLRSTDLRGLLVDVSMTGLAMQLCQPLERDSSVELRISNPRFDQHVDCAAQVLRCRQHDSENWHIVCRFERSLTFQQIHRIGRHLFASTIV